MPMLRIRIFNLFVTNYHLQSFAHPEIKQQIGYIQNSGNHRNSESHWLGIPARSVQLKTPLFWVLFRPMKIGCEKMCITVATLKDWSFERLSKLCLLKTSICELKLHSGHQTRIYLSILHVKSRRLLSHGLTMIVSLWKFSFACLSLF